MSVSSALPNCSSIMSASAASSVTSSCGSSTVSSCSVKPGTSSSAATVKKIGGCETAALLCESQALGVCDIVGSLEQATMVGTCEDSMQRQQQTFEQLQVHQLHGQNGLSEDARTLQLALELSLVGLNDEQVCYFERQQQHHHQLHQQQQQHHHQTQLQKTDYDLDTLQAISAAIAAAANHQNPHNNAITGNLFSTDTQTNVSGLLMPSTILEDRSKKSQNMTECVPVPSSEHVAEIVGRQGCKIKALRAKTNTYIKTPVRGEEPVFVVTGRKEDVNKAKREILSAADHFSLIRATRKPSMEGSSNNSSNHSSSNGACGGVGGSSLVGSNGTGLRSVAAGPPSLPGQVTIQVRVPYRVVGLVVGPKGATIKHIQQETQTYIVTPSREKEPIFEVTGMPEQVQTARKQIEAHIALRTGNTQSNSNAVSAGIAVSGELLPNELHTINTLSQMLNEDINPDFLVSLYKNGICSGLDYGDSESLGGGVDGGGIGVCTGLNTSSTGGAAYTTHMNSRMLNSTTTTTTRFQMQQQQQQQQQLQQPTMTSLNSIISEQCSNNLQEQQLQLQQISNEKAIFHQNDNIKSSLNLANAAAINSNIAAANVPYSSILAAAANHVTNSVIVNGLTRSCSSASSTTSTKSTNNSAGGSSSGNSPPELLNIWKNINDSMIDVDEGIGDSPNIWNLPAAAASLSTLNDGTQHCSPTASISPTDSLLGDITTNSQHIPITHGNDFNAATTTNITGAAAAATSTTTLMRRECYVCAEKEVSNLALVPCGHNMFCMDCANHICLSIDAVCPVCSSIVYHAMRILA